MTTIPADDLARLAQQCVAACPVIVLGTGASIPYGIGGMDALRDYLVTRLGSSPIRSDAEVAELLSLLDSKDLERALTELTLKEHQERQVIGFAWEKVHGDDRSLFDRILTRSTEPHLVKLFRHLFDSTHRDVSVVTTNYDRLAEYSANIAGFGFTNGFSDGYIAPRAVSDSARSCRYQCQSSTRNRVVRVWKVHGSIDWFSDGAGRVFCLPSATALAVGLDPVIVTPGTTKYMRTHEEPFRTVIGEADRALSDAGSFLCVGYGFNDTHIHPKLTERAANGRKPLVVLAKVLTDAAKATITSLTRTPYLAIEQGSSGDLSRVYTNEHAAGVELASPNLWDLGVFLDSYIVASRR